jgi:soluble lytic murein transglycosylase
LAASSGLAADRQLTIELLNKRARPDLGVVIARDAARDKIILVQFGYPVPAYAYPAAPEQALVLAITRQESNFDPGALSSAGARGLMQLMPATARALARAGKITYSRDRLTTDPSYNMRLGSTYLNSLVNNFGGSYVLAAAGYNAGPGRAQQWIKQFGDPRDAAVDAVDWVEQIPFSETRGYVQKVMENLMVYRAVLANSSRVAQTLEAELKTIR